MARFRRARAVLRVLVGVCTVEPGYFRSNFLHPGNKKDQKNVIPDQEGTAVRKGEAFVQAYDNNQPGDIQKGAWAILDVPHWSLGQRDSNTSRDVLRTDTSRIIRAKYENTVNGLEDWKDVTFPTNLEDN